MINLIIGERSALSQNLKKKLKKSKIISSNNFLNLKIQSKSNIIINSFYPSKQISKLEDYNEFLNQSLLILAEGLMRLNKKLINKIIYTSSSSIYGLNTQFKHADYGNRKIYAASKLLAENIVTNFSTKNKIPYTIARVFNLYGENDKFSIVSKLIDSNKNKDFFILNNNGSAIRDFISFNQVSDIYNQILKNKKSEIVDVGTGYGTQILDIVKTIENKKLIIKKKSIPEQDSSISEKNFYNKNIKFSDFENFIKKKFNIKKKISLKKYYLKNNYQFKDYIEGTIIYGAGNAGSQFYNLQKINNLNSIYCFVDDNKKKQKKFIDDKKIISFKELVKISKNRVITNIVIAIPSLKKKSLLKKINQLKKISLSVNYIPLKNNLLKEKISLQDINYSDFLDIFERKTYQLNSKLLAKFKGKNILVTGAAGSIGTAICSKLKDLKTKKIIALDKSEIGIYNLKNSFNNKNIKYILGDINRKSILENIERRYKIDLVFHTAAYKHLNILEDNICEAVRNNIFGTLNLINVFKKKKLIIISTDKAVKPKSILGLTKRISEIASLNYSEKSSKIIVVRFGNVFASQGSAINLFLDQIKSGGPVTLTNKNVERYFMSSGEAANLVLQGSQLSENRKVLVLDMGKPVKLIKIVKKLIKTQQLESPDHSVRIKYIGLKKGEKLKENLFFNKIKRSTSHKNILIADEPKYNANSTEYLLQKLKRHLNNYDDKNILKEMKKFLKYEL